jgi:ferric-dicitrate binding protein FerR (iron transport regulator)
MTSHISAGAQNGIAALAAQQYVDQLYASLAWDATIQLGDAALASRLVERVLRRAWNERERFATVDAFLRHASDASREAIAREAERRQDVTMFDDAAQRSLPMPGDLHLMSAEQVHRRLLGQVAAPAPSRPHAGEATQGRDVVPEPAAAPPVPAPVVTPSPIERDTVAATVASVGQTPAIAAARSIAEGVVATRGGRSTPAAATALPVPPAAQPSGRERPHLRGAAYITGAERRLPVPPRILAMAAGGIAVVLFVAWRLFGGPSSEELAIAALDAPAGLSDSTARGKQTTMALPGGSSAVLGASASVRASATFADGARALTIVGPVALSIAGESDAPVAVGVLAQRFVTGAGAVAFTTDGERVLVQVDSGEVHYLNKGKRTPIGGGSAIAVEADGTIVPLDSSAVAVAFAWRRGRLQVLGATVLALRERVQQWFGVDVRFASPRAASERISFDVPLASADSLIAALAALGDGKVERSGTDITVGAAPGREASAPVAARPKRASRLAKAERSRPKTPTIPKMPDIAPLPTIPEP